MAVAEATPDRTRLTGQLTPFDAIRPALLAARLPNQRFCSGPSTQVFTCVDYSLRLDPKKMAATT